MLENILWGLGWLLVVTGVGSIAVKVLGTEELVLMFAGSSRNLDVPIAGFAIGLVFLGLSSVIEKLDEILQRDETHKK